MLAEYKQGKAHLIELGPPGVIRKLAPAGGLSVVTRVAKAAMQLALFAASVGLFGAARRVCKMKSFCSTAQ